MSAKRRRGSRRDDAVKSVRRGGRGVSPAAVLLADARRQSGDLGSWPALIEALLDAVWLVDAESLLLLRGNAAAAALLQLPLDSLPGRPVQTLVATPEDQQFWSEAAGRRGEPLLSDSLLRRADGSLLPVARRITHVQAGGPAGLYLVALHDLSAQRRVEDERDTLVGELRATLESTADGILVTDLGGAVRAFNRRFAAPVGPARDAAAASATTPRCGCGCGAASPTATATRERLAAIEDATAAAGERHAHAAVGPGARAHQPAAALEGTADRPRLVVSRPERAHRGTTGASTSCRTPMR